MQTVGGWGTSGFRIRRATLADIDAVMRVNLESLPENYWRGFYAYILENWPESFLVAEADGEIVGYALSRVEEHRDPVLLGLASELDDTGTGSVRRILDALNSFLSESKPVGHLVSIAVLEEYRGRGIGKTLLQETIRVMRDIYKTVSIYLEVRVSNERAIRLYEKMGFKKVRLVPGYYRDGENAWVMVLRLLPVDS